MKGWISEFVYVDEPDWVDPRINKGIAETSLNSNAYSDYGLKVVANGKKFYVAYKKDNACYGEQNLRHLEHEYGLPQGYISKVYLPQCGIYGDTFCNEFSSETFSVTSRAINCIVKLLKELK